MAFFSLLEDRKAHDRGITGRGAFAYRRRWLRDRLRSRLKQGGMLCPEYHKSARDCLRWAAKARTEEQRKQFMSLAHDWTQAALLMEEDLKRS